MDSDTIADLKQFITATVSQQTFDIREDIGGVKQDIADLKNDVNGLDEKIDNLSDSVAEAIANSNDTTDAQLKDHNIRITRLEEQSIS